MSDSPVEWLRRTIEGDRATAHSAIGLLGIEAAWHTVGQFRERGLTQADAQHMAVHDPRDVIADCDAKLCLIEICESAMAVGEIKPGTTWNDDAAGAELAEAALRVLASGYQRRDGYPGEAA